LTLFDSCNYVYLFGGQLQNFPGQYIQFENGAFVTEDPEIIKFIMSNKKFGIDIFATETASRDPFKSVRVNSEPDKIMHFLDGGHIEKTIRTGKTPRQAFDDAVTQAATRIATEMLKKMASEMKPQSEQTFQTQSPVSIVNQPANTAPVNHMIGYSAPQSFPQAKVIKSEKPLSFVQDAEFDMSDEEDSEEGEELGEDLIPGLTPIKPLVAVADEDQTEDSDYENEEATPVKAPVRKSPGRPLKKK
jgi:hypothetical protein